MIPTYLSFIYDTDIILSVLFARHGMKCKPSTLFKLLIIQSGKAGMHTMNGKAQWESCVAKFYQENHVNSVSMLCSHSNVGFHAPIINEIKPPQQDICNLTLPYLYFHSHLWKDRIESKTVLCQPKLSHPLLFLCLVFKVTFTLFVLWKFREH